MTIKTLTNQEKRNTSQEALILQVPCNKEIRVIGVWNRHPSRIQFSDPAESLL